MFFFFENNYFCHLETFTAPTAAFFGLLCQIGHHSFLAQMTSYFVCFHFVRFLLHCCCWFSVFVHLCVCLSSQVQFSVCQRYSDLASSTSMLSHPIVSPVPNVFSCSLSLTHSLTPSLFVALSVLFTPLLSYSLWRPSFTNRLYHCCSGGGGRVFLSRTRRPSFTRRHFEFVFFRGTVLSDWRPSFTDRLCDWCSGGGGRVSLTPEDSARSTICSTMRSGIHSRD